MRGVSIIGLLGFGLCVGVGCTEGSPAATSPDPGGAADTGEEVGGDPDVGAPSDSGSDAGVDTGGPGDEGPAPGDEGGAPDEAPDSAPDVPVDAGDAGPTVVPVIDDYECFVLPQPSGCPIPFDPGCEALEDKRKIFNVDLTYEGDFHVLGAPMMAVGYSVGPNAPGPEHYEVIVEDAEGAVLESFYLPFAGAIFVEGEAGCQLTEPGSGPRLAFDLVEPAPSRVRIFDLTEPYVCSNGSYEPKGGELVQIDLSPCVAKFCAEGAVEGDPMCP